MHKGELGVRDRSDGKQGNEFRFTLPLHPKQNKMIARLL
ncbi:hypothetical protein bmyco0002_55300 [Bacillus pseudomycoides]|nr:hypothetical protein bmyco0002_55300 [Bacillus pseudomycoides]